MTGKKPDCEARWEETPEAREWLKDIKGVQKVRALVGYAAGGTTWEAAKAAGVSKRTVCRWRQLDLAFKAAWEEAKFFAQAALEDQLHERAQAGPEDKGSAVLLMFALKAMDRDKYEGSKDKGEGHQPPPMTINLVTPREGE